MESPSFIDRFYPSELAVAHHFEEVLREFCAEESVPTDWHRERSKAGHITFTSRRIAALINSNYSVSVVWGFASERSGTLAPSVLESASRADMLRYVAGSYTRFGDYKGRFKNSKSTLRAFFLSPNSVTKFVLLRDVLVRLGCSNVRLYNDFGSNLVPTTYVLTFSPTAEVKAVTGIRHEISLPELKAMDSHLEKIKRPRVL